jgi:hypothetical protein
MRIARVTPCERGRERVLDHGAVPVEHVHDCGGHLGVVRRDPRRPWELARFDELLDILGVDEEALAEGIADGEAVERRERAGHPGCAVVREHRGH